MAQRHEPAAFSLPLALPLWHPAKLTSRQSPQRPVRRMLVRSQATLTPVRPGGAGAGAEAGAGSHAEEGGAVQIKSVADFLRVQASSAQGGKTVYAFFHAGYCRACKAVLPKVRALAAEYDDCVFATVKLEDARELAMRLHVRSVPYVQIYRGALGKVDEFPCAPSSWPRFKETVEELSSEARSETE